MAVTLTNTASLVHPANAASYAVPVPSGRVSGDLMVVIVANRKNNVISPPDGTWTTWRAEDADTNVGSVGVFYKTLSGAIPSTYTFTASDTSSGTNQYLAGFASYVFHKGTLDGSWNVTTATTLDVSSLPANDVTEPFDIPNITLPDAGFVLAGIAYGAVNTGYAFINPSAPYVSVFNYAATGILQTIGAAGYRSYSSAGTYSAGSYTSNNPGGVLAIIGAVGVSASPYVAPDPEPEIDAPVTNYEAAPLELSGNLPYYEFLLQNVATRDIINIVNPMSRNITLDLFDDENASFSMSAYDPAAVFINDDAATDLLVVRNNIPLFRGRVTSINRNFDDMTISCAAVGYKAVLDWQLIYPMDVTLTGLTATRNYVNKDAVEIAEALINLVQARRNNNLYISLGNNAATAKRTRQYEVGQKIGAAIDNLGRVQQNADGSDIFEWWLEPTYEGSVFHTFSPFRGKNTPSFLLDYGGSVISAQSATDVAASANVLIMQGTNSSPAVYQMVYASDYDTDAGGARAVMLTDSTPTKSAEILNRARYLMANEVGSVLPGYTLLLRPGAWNGPRDLFIGDLATLSIVVPGTKVVRSDLRCVSMTINVDDNGVESVAVQVGKKTRNVLEALSYATRTANYVLSQRTLAVNAAAQALIAKGQNNTRLAKTRTAQSNTYFRNASNTARREGI